MNLVMFRRFRWRVFLTFARRLIFLFYFGWRLILWIEDSWYFMYQGGEMWPVISLFFREDKHSIEDHFEWSNLRIGDILVRFRIDVLILCYFEGNQMRGKHIADDIELRVVDGDEFGYWVGEEVRLRKCSWYLASSWWVHQLWVSQERQYST